MKHDDDGIHFTREDLLSDLQLLQSFYEIMGKEKVIGWILKQDCKFHEEKQCGISKLNNCRDVTKDFETEAEYLERFFKNHN